MLLRGRDHGVQGTFASQRIGNRVAAAISAGNDIDSPSLAYKGDPFVTNEDALCAVASETHLAIAVADGHFGVEASHRLIEAVHEHWSTSITTTGDALAELVEQLAQLEGDDDRSATTLLLVVADRISRSGFGLSFGDSTCALLGDGHAAEPVNKRDGHYVALGRPRSFRRPDVFGFQAERGDLLLVFTDGIDECHYRHPDTSIRPHHMQRIAADAGHDPDTTVDRLMRTALTGVDGNPGGQDNIALVAARL